jgi:uncharacterized protein (TIGR02145 family)
MKRIPVVFMILFWIVLCNAQSYKISGVVKNSAGTGIEGATVRLGIANISTTTGPGGSFTLTESSPVIFPSDKAVSNMKCPVDLRNGKLSFVAAHQGQAQITIYDCNGRLRLSLCETVSTGNNVLSLPSFANGLYVYKMDLEGRQYIFRSIAGIAANGSKVTAMNTSATTKLAKTTAGIDDLLLASKRGYQLYSLGIKNSDTSGIQITLSPFETGTVTDKDGIVYQTIKIGNQVWTTENIRTTKYNDGTPIAHLSDNPDWDTTTQGAYCFYNNSADPAFQQKWGALYNFFAANSGKLAPAGWRVAKGADWDSLQNYLSANGYTYDGTAGTSIIKSIVAETDWASDTLPMSIGNDLSKNNISGFSALPGGCCVSGGKFSEMDNAGYWWTTDSFNEMMAVYRRLAYFDNNIYNWAFPTSKQLGLSIRLVKE